MTSNVTRVILPELGSLVIAVTPSVGTTYASVLGHELLVRGMH